MLKAAVAAIAIVVTRTITNAITNTIVKTVAKAAMKTATKAITKTAIGHVLPFRSVSWSATKAVTVSSP